MQNKVIMKLPLSLSHLVCDVLGDPVELRDVAPPPAALHDLEHGAILVLRQSVRVHLLRRRRENQGRVAPTHEALQCGRAWEKKSAMQGFWIICANPRL